MCGVTLDGGVVCVELVLCVRCDDGCPVSSGACAVFGGRETVCEPGRGARCGGAAFDPPAGVGKGGEASAAGAESGGGGGCRIIQRVYSRWFQ